MNRVPDVPADIAERLAEPLKEGLTYFDATPSIEELAKAFTQLEKSMQMQALINSQLMTLLKDAQQRIAFLEGTGQKPNALILPPRLQ